MVDISEIFASAPDNSLLYAGHYDAVLVGLSVAVAIFASYAALLVSQHVASSPVALRRRAWTLVGGVCLGLGIWAMHFVGMLALSLPCSTGYSASITFLSMLPSILACTLVLHIISRPAISRAQLLTSGLLLGAGIGSMHYVGMAALRLDGILRYNLQLFLVSIVVAVCLATFAVWVKFKLHHFVGGKSNIGVVISACFIGFSVSGMHYTAMAAAYFLRDGDAKIVDSQIGPNLLAILVLTAASVIIAITLFASFATKKRRRYFQASYKFILFLTVCWSIAAWVTASNYRNDRVANYYADRLRSGDVDARNAGLHIEEHLAMIRALSSIFSADQDVIRALRRWSPSTNHPTALSLTEKARRSQDPLVDALAARLRVAVRHLDVDLVMALNAGGEIIAASESGEASGAIGYSAANRVFFDEIPARREDVYFSIDWTTSRPAVFVSHPVVEDGHFLGAIVLKRNISGLSRWIDPFNAFVTDSHGVVLLATQSALESKYVPGGELLTLNRADRHALYGQREFQPIAIQPLADSLMPNAVRMEMVAAPVAMVSNPVASGLLRVFVVQPLDDITRIDLEKLGLFVVIFTVGVLVIASVAAVVFYLRETRKADADLRISATAFESHEAMMVTDSNAVILRVNRAFLSLCGYDENEIVGRTPSMFKSDRHEASFYTDMWDSLNRTGVWQGEIWDRRKNGEEFQKWLTITAVQSGDRAVTHYVAMHSDITQRKRAESEIQNLAFFDSLTGLPNRRLLMDRLGRALANCDRRKQWGALLFIDLDHFKTLNDTRGHDMGDLLLKQASDRLLGCMREGDTVARLGGDEFVVLLEGLDTDKETSASHTRTVAEKLLTVLNQPFALTQHEHHGSASIGITLFADPDESSDELFKRADLALYQAKAAGRNTFRFFDPVMQAVILARSGLEVDLRHGLQREEFCLHYQPQVGPGKTPIGAEALLRWNQPQRGFVSPLEFIPLAEDSGLILPLGAWVLRTACSQLALWAKLPTTCDMILAVNVSAHQFSQPNFVAQVLSTLKTTGARGDRLKLELTESVVVENVGDIIEKMTVLKGYGVQFSMDDFGTGYSSLSYLRRLPLDQLKIDRSFVDNVLGDAHDAAIVRTIIALGQSLGLHVIAEGVETESQQVFLAQAGCMFYQGFLCSKPLPVDEFERFLLQHPMKIESH